MMAEDRRNQNIIIYNTSDGKASVTLYAKDGMVWMNQNQIAELFDTSKQNIGQHIASILKESELDANSVVKNYFTTALCCCAILCKQSGRAERHRVAQASTITISN